MKKEDNTAKMFHALHSALHQHGFNHQWRLEDFPAYDNDAEAQEARQLFSIMITVVSALRENFDGRIRNLMGARGESMDLLFLDIAELGAVCMKLLICLGIGKTGSALISYPSLGNRTYRVESREQPFGLAISRLDS